MADDNRLLPSHNEKATQPTPHSKEAAEDMINPFDLRDDYQQAALLCLFVMIVFWVGTMQLIHRYAQEYYTWTVSFIEYKAVMDCDRESERLVWVQSDEKHAPD
jgi:hypothetical protein